MKGSIKMAEVNQISLLEAAQGAIKERVDSEVARIVENIFNPNTDASKKRQLVIKVEFTPNNDRSYVQIKATAESKLQPFSAIQTAISVGVDSNGEFHAVEMVPNVPGQMSFDGSEQPKPNVINVSRKAV